MMKTLLVPVDFSEESMAAVKQALELANAVGLSIRLIHVKKKKSYYLGFSTSNEEQFPDDEIKSHLESVVKNFKSGYKAGGKFEFVIRHGSITHEIIEESEAEDVYAILTGLQGNTSLKDYLVGSNAYRIVAAAEKPVFAVRKSMETRPVKKILLPIEDKSDTRVKVPVVAALAKELDAEIMVLGITDSPYEEMLAKVQIYVKQTLEYFRERDLKCSSKELVSVEVPQKIVAVSKEEGADMIAFVSDMTDDILGQMLSVSVKYILHQAECPLLCVPVNILD
ncbi:universal stress protein [Saccharicrinis sp. FJH62]|uniref:universal stress protein n=1 Tax=Saccharicrinis sp. FJH62 TaxID=3344657 RepID=UPI0035D4DE0E